MISSLFVEILCTYIPKKKKSNNNNKTEEAKNSTTNEIHTQKKAQVRLCLICILNVLMIFFISYFFFLSSYFIYDSIVECSVQSIAHVCMNNKHTNCLSISLHKYYISIHFLRKFLYLGTSNMSTMTFYYKYLQLFDTYLIVRVVLVWYISSCIFIRNTLSRRR